MKTKPSLLIIFLTVFIDLIGFGIVLPLLPIIAANFKASGLMIGILMASYSAMQFVFAPILGGISDRVGRRPILLISMAGSAISYLIFALGSGMSGQIALVVLLGSRLFAGICGANVTVAQAYIADISLPEERSKKMGLIGMAFGLGFVFGPILGIVGLLLLGITGPGWIAATLCAANFLFAWKQLPESLKPGSDRMPGRPHLNQFMQTMRMPKIGLLIALFFLATFIFGAFETTLGLLASKNFGLKLQEAHGALDLHSNANGFLVGDWVTVMALFVFCGVIGAVVQGGAIGRAVKVFGEPRLISLSFLLVAASLAPMPYVGAQFFGWPGFLFLLAILSIGTSIARPPIFGMLSILSPASEQGMVIGVAQSAGSLARIFGPIFAGVLFFENAPVLYLVCAVLSLITGLIAWQYLVRSKH